MLDAAIIGAPRAGTTTLYDWLDAHPVVQGSSPKETYFFMDETHPLALRQVARGEPTVHTAGLDAFDRFFDGEEPKIRFEATTHHYYQETAREVFSRLEVPPHIFFVLRQPAYRIRSSFLFTKHNRGLIDPSLSFNRYVDSLLEGNSSVLDRYYHSDSSLYIAKRELELSNYAKWLDIWVECLGERRVHPLLFEEFVEGEKRLVEKICQVVGVDESFYSDASISSQNETTLVRSPTLQRLAYKVGTRIPDGGLKQAAKTLYEWMQVQSSSSSSASDTDRGVERLEEYFEPFNRKLEKATSLDLSQWR